MTQINVIMDDREEEYEREVQKNGEDDNKIYLFYINKHLFR